MHHQEVAITTKYSVHSGGIECPPPENYRWPDGKRLGVCFRFAFEWWSDGAWPGTSPMGNPLKSGVPDLNALGWAEYGHRAGVFRLLKTYARHKIRATVMVSGIMAERYPDIVKRILDEGHEVAAHSYAMDKIPIYQTEDEERANIHLTTELIEKACGVRPRGWSSPRATPSHHTARLLAEADYDWHGDSMSDDVPYLVRYGKKSIVAVPSNMEINDLPLYMRHGQSPRQFLELFDDWLECGRNFETGAIKIDPTVHCHVFGRPIGAFIFDKLLAKAAAADDLWIGTRGEIAVQVKKLMGEKR